MAGVNGFQLQFLRAGFIVSVSFLAETPHPSPRTLRAYGQNGMGMGCALKVYLAHSKHFAPRRAFCFAYFLAGPLRFLSHSRDRFQVVSGSVGNG